MVHSDAVLDMAQELKASGTSFVLAIMYMAHKKGMKQLELEEMKLKLGKQQASTEELEAT